MLTMMEEIQGDDPIDSKALLIKDTNKAGEFPMILTAFEEEDNEPLDKAGFRGRYVLVNLIDGSIQDTFYNVHSVEHPTMTKDVKRAIDSIIRGWQTHGRNGVDWSELRHGETYEAKDLLQMAQNHGS